MTKRCRVLWSRVKDTLLFIRSALMAVRPQAIDPAEEERRDQRTGTTIVVIVVIGMLLSFGALIYLAITLAH